MGRIEGAPSIAYPEMRSLANPWQKVAKIFDVYICPPFLSRYQVLREIQIAARLEKGFVVVSVCASFCCCYVDGGVRVRPNASIFLLYDQTHIR